MKLSSLTPASISKLMTVSIFAVVAMIATNSIVNVLSVQAQVTTQNNQIQSILSNIQKEATRRDGAITKATDALNSTTTISPQAKSQVLQSLGDAAKANDTALDKAKSTTTLADMQKVAQSFDGQYDKYATSQAQGMLLKDSDQQSQTQQQLLGTAKDVQALIDSQKADNNNGSSGSSSEDMQAQLDNIMKLIASIAAILASVTAVIIALVAGDYAKAATLFVAIVGQLAQNLASILNVQSSLQIMISTLGG